MDNGKMDRRQFLVCAAAATTAATAMAGAEGAKGKDAAKAAKNAAKEPLPPLIASAPVLQNAAETSMGVSFAVSADASGWVEYSRSPDMRDAKRAYSGGCGLMDVNPSVALVRLTGLAPATKYYYRIGADRISYKGGYKMKNLGPERDAKVHSFTTLGAAATGSFCVINDTHDRKPALGAALAKVRELNPAVVLWNGDASNTSETIETAMGIFIHTHPDHPEYASDTPYMFVRGNHDFRGRFNRRLGDLMMLREPAERSGEFAELGRNFVQRLGDIALIGLDTGEDKLDDDPRFAGIFRMKEYREMQARWLAEVVETEAVRTARHKVAICHIPLFDPNPRLNPGDVSVHSPEAKNYSPDFAGWQRGCARLWGPSLAKAGVKLVIAAHQHQFRHDPPDAGRPWAQIVGGGPDMDPAKGNLYPTVIHGRSENGELRVTVYNVRDGVVVFDSVIGDGNPGSVGSFA